MSSQARADWAKLQLAAVFSVLAGSVLLLAACGGSPPTSGNAAVAHLGSTTTTASSSQGNGTQPDASSRGGGGPGPGGGPGQGGGMSDPGASQSQLVAFAHCVQTHGDPGFPEPNAQGVFSGASPNSPGFRTAANHCTHLLPNGGRPTPAQDEQAVAQALAVSRCMRAHGIADFPDPQIHNGGAQISISLRGGPGSDLDPNSPRFQAAQQACGSLGGKLPGGGPKSSTHGGAK